MNQYDRYLVAMVTLSTIASPARPAMSEEEYARTLEKAWREVNLWEKLSTLQQDVLRIRSKAQPRSKRRLS